jgi:4,4'-diaponeurosporenoate glycosyltransferase
VTFAFTLVPMVLGWLAGWVLLVDVRHLPRPARRCGATADLGSASSSITVIVPARNEAVRLPDLLAALARSSTPAEVIVVDDGSTDGTAGLARRAGARVVASEPGPGWTGKAQACQRGADAARGDILVFLDADTRPDVDFVGDLAARASTTHGVVSVQPWHRLGRRYEHASAVPNLVAVLGAGTGGPTGRERWRRPVGFGPAMSIERDRYLEIGGHGGVRGEVAEDLALAELADRAGLPVEAWAGGGIEYRMYPEGIGSLVEGWTKNLAAGAASVATARVALVAVWITAVLLVLPALFHGWTGVALCVLVTGQGLVLLRRVGSFGVLDAVLLPVLAAGFVGLFARSSWRRVRGRPVEWRGRTVSQDAR